MTVGPVFVMVVPATAAKLAADPRSGVVAAACAAGTAVADSRTDAHAAVAYLQPALLRPKDRCVERCSHGFSP